MRLIIPFLFALTCAPALAATKCEERGKLAGVMVITKYQTIEALRAKPASGPMGEPWRVMAYITASEYEKLGDSLQRVRDTAKLIESNDLSNNWQVEFLLYKDYFQALCEAGLKVQDVKHFDSSGIVDCLADPPERAACIRSKVELIRRESEQ